jgi:ribose transport system substrate-binding protein
VVNCVDPVAVIPAVKKAYDNKIPVLIQNANIAREGEKYIHGFVGSQGLDQGYAVGKMMAEKFGQKQAKVVVLGGKSGQSDYINRVTGMKNAWADAGVNYTIISDQPADWSKDKALTLMQDLLTRFSDGNLDIVFGVDDPMALGAAEAIRAAGRKNIAVYGVNGNIDAFTAIKAGEMAGTALQMSYLVGVYTIREAYDIKSGRLVPDKMMAPTAAVTTDNIAQWQQYAW